VWATIIGGVIALSIVLIPVEPFKTLANFSWFIGAAAGALAYFLMSKGLRETYRADASASAADDVEA
jgi:NCS1 family nucleobase:cation symporter-1